MPFDALFLGLPVGAAFGFVAQRGRFCMSTAFLNGFFLRDFTLLRAYGLAVAVQMLALPLLITQTDLVSPRYIPFFWVAQMTGGFLFGAGMALVGGCATAIWYRMGEGSPAAFLAILGYMGGVAMTGIGIFRPLMKALRGPVIGSSGTPATLPHLLGMPLWLLIPLFLIPIFLFLLGKPDGYLGGWTWVATGMSIGLIGTLAWVSAGAAGHQGGLGTVEASASLVQSLLLGNHAKINWATFMLLGIPLGSFLAARSSGEFALSFPPATQLLRSLGGGWVMGVGAALSGGCNISHGLTQLPLLAAGSLLAMLFIVLGLRTGVYVLQGRRER